MRVDIHAHMEKIDGEYQIDDMLYDMERHDIQKRVISTLDGETIQKGNTEISEIVKKYPNNMIGCALINPASATVEADIDHALSLSEMKMVEFNSFIHGYYPDHCDGLHLVFERINQHPLPVKIFSGLGAHALPQQWEAFVKRYPNIPFIFLHVGCFDYGYSCVDIVARNKNAYVETSNQYEMQILKKTFANIPMDKIMFGSSYPERFTRNGYELYELFSLSDEDVENIEYNNAMELLNRYAYQ